MANDNYITGIRGFTADGAPSADGYQGQPGQMPGEKSFAFGAMFSPIVSGEGTIWANRDFATSRGWSLGYVGSALGPAVIVLLGTNDQFVVELNDGAGAVVHAVVRVEFDGNGTEVQIYIAGTRVMTASLTDPFVVPSTKAPTVGFVDSTAPDNAARGLIHGMWYQASGADDALPTASAIAEHYRLCTAAYDMAQRLGEPFQFASGPGDFTNRFSARDAVVPGAVGLGGRLPEPAPIWIPRSGSISLTRRRRGAFPALGTMSMKNPMWASAPPQHNNQ